MSVSMFTIYRHKCHVAHTFINMVATNHTLLEKLLLSSMLDHLIRSSCLDKEITCVSWTSIGGLGQNCALEGDKCMHLSSRLYSNNYYVVEYLHFVGVYF